MEIRIIETGEVKELGFIDPKTGIDIVQDLMGDADFIIDEDEDGFPVTSLPKDDFEWWESYLSRRWEVETAASKLGIKWLDHSDSLGGDLEDDVAAKEQIVQAAEETNGE